MVRNFVIIPLVLMLAAQKPVKKPDVHPDFHFGSYPWSRTGADLMKDELSREVIVAFAEGWSIGDSFYVTVQTLTTVGYGDLPPHNPAGRAFAVVVMLMGVGGVALAASTIVQSIVQSRSNERSAAEAYAGVHKAHSR